MTLIGGKHPNYGITAPHYEKLFEEFAASDRIQTMPMLPYDAFVRELVDKDIAVDLMGWNLERELAITIRSTTYLWAGVPVIYNDYADLHRLIDTYDAGWSVGIGNDDALEKVLTEIFSSPDVVKRKSANARKLASEHFSWKMHAENLLQLVKSGTSKRSWEVDIFLDLAEMAELKALKEKPIAQEFTCRLDGLSRVECLIATHGQTIQSGLTLTLKDLSKHLTVASRRLEATELFDHGWATLEFPPIRKSAGNRYKFELVGDGVAEQTTVTPWAAKSRRYPMHALTYAGNDVGCASLCLRTTCAPEVSV
jgi:hypothetical protein